MANFIESINAMREYGSVSKCGCGDEMVDFGLITELDGMSAEDAKSVVLTVSGVGCCGPTTYNIEQATINNYCVCKCSGSTSGDTSGNTVVIHGDSHSGITDEGEHYSDMEVSIDKKAESDITLEVTYEYIDGIELKTGTTEVTISKDSDTTDIRLVGDITDSKIITAEVVDQGDDDKNEYSKYECERPEGQCYSFMCRRNQLNKIVFGKTGDIDSLVINSDYINANAQSFVLAASGDTANIVFTVAPDYIDGLDEQDDYAKYVIDNNYDYGFCFAIDTSITDFQILDAMESPVEYFVIDSAVNIPRIDSNGNTVNEFYNVYASYDDVDAQYANAYDSSISDASDVTFDFKIIRKNN